MASNQSRAQREAQDLVREKQALLAEAGAGSDPSLESKLSELDAKLAAADEGLLKWRGWIGSRGGETDEFDRFVRQYVGVRVTPDESDLLEEEPAVVAPE